MRPIAGARIPVSLPTLTNSISISIDLNVLHRHDKQILPTILKYVARTGSKLILPLQ